MAIKYFGVENFRTFGANGKMAEFEFAPITILTGTNNSGKSSLIKALILLNDTLSSGEIPSMDFSKGEHNLSNFDQIKCKHLRKNDTISFSTDIDKKHIVSYKFNRFNEICAFPKEISITKKNNNRNQKNIFQLICTDYDIDEYIDYSLGKLNDKTVTKKEKNHSAFKYSLRLDLVSSLKLNPYLEKEIKELRNYTFFLGDDEEEGLEFIDFTLNLLPAFKNEINFETALPFKYYLREIVDPNGAWKFLSKYFSKKKIPGDWDCSSILYSECGLILIEILDQVSNIFEKIPILKNEIHFIPSIRAHPDRFIMYENKTTFSKVLLDFMRRISIKEFCQTYMSKWFKEFGIGIEINIQNILGFGAVVNVLNDKNFKINMTDLGFGYSQLIPIILKIAWKYSSIYVQDKNEDIFIIEELEAHLHPAYQSKLAEFFVDSYKTFNSQFILETHSEYLIRKLQYLIAKKEIKKEDVAIYYFGPDCTKEDYITKIEIDDKGFMVNDFGPGFFDEAARWISELWNMPREN